MGTFSASPSKNFFIHMLTRDISLEKAIIDLIDNSVDAVRKREIKVTEDLFEPNLYKGYYVNIMLNKKRFLIKDNCGGISKKVAEEYAFKFGRPPKVSTENSNTIGRFGVGMKRAIFKIGREFIVESKCGEDHFFLDVNAENWNNEETPWEFEFTDIDDNVEYEPELEEDGVFIKITNLYDSVKQEFDLDSFLSKIINEIERTLSYCLQRGFKIEINSVSLKENPIKLLVSKSLRPYYEEFTKSDVRVKIFAGIGEPNPNLAGWYIFCNDRLMIDKDKTNLTGWEGGKNYYDDTGVQKFHNKVAMFRGLVFFFSDDPKKLPMTTTKWGIDTNSTIYKFTRVRMIDAMKIVLAELNKMNSAALRKKIVESSRSVDVISYQREDGLKNEFIFPKTIIKRTENTEAKITYFVDRNLLSLVKEYLGVNTNTEVGEKTFNYFVEMKEINE